MKGEKRHNRIYAVLDEALENRPASFGPRGIRTPLAAAVLPVLVLALLIRMMLGLELSVAVVL